MTNAERFQMIFGLRATELWCKSAEEIFEWLNQDVPDTNDGDMIYRQAAIEAMRTCYDTERKEFDNGDEYINYDQAVRELESLPSVSGGGRILPCRCTECKYYWGEEPKEDNK